MGFHHWPSLSTQQIARWFLGTTDLSAHSSRRLGLRPFRTRESLIQHRSFRHRPIRLSYNIPPRLRIRTFFFWHEQTAGRTVRALNKSAMSEPANSTLSTAPQPPPRKRRRPALSCEQCRRRKIKCDRAYPCSQCLQSKTGSCSYSPDTIRRLRHVNETSTVPAPSSLDLPNRTREVTGDSSIHTSSTRVSPNAISNSAAPLSGSWTSPSFLNIDDEISQPETLLHGIKELVNTGVQTHFPTSESFLRDSTGNGLRGTISKTRFFGPSHWMHSYGVARHPSIPADWIR